MSGLYIHIPFCKKACIYCNFHFSLQHRQSAEMVDAILKEMDIQKDFFDGAPLESIYFGGGTPSLLESSAIGRILHAAHDHFAVLQGAEITLEANPEDVTTENLQAWKSAGINRLSIGIQSLNDYELRIMNRNHNSEQARQCVELALRQGIRSVNVDLIFGSPWLDDTQWQENMNWAFDSGADHISAYGLTIEPKTLLHQKVEKHLLPSTDDQRQARQYEMLAAEADKKGWEFYEISNLSKAGHRAVHNSNYWKNKIYLGLGPSAHSYRQNERSWNVADNKKYMEALQRGERHFEKETLSPENRYNEYIMTHLRTIEGIQPAEMEAIGLLIPPKLENTIQQWLERGLAAKNGEAWALTLSGRLLCDTLTAEIMI